MYREAALHASLLAYARKRKITTVMVSPSLIWYPGKKEGWNTNVKVNREDGGYDAQQSRTGAERSLIPELQNNIIEQNMSGINQGKLLHPAVIVVVVVWYTQGRAEGKK